MNLTTYSRLTGVWFLAVLATVWAIASWLLPVDGDLARVGGYAENDFGWRAPQTTFDKNLFHVTTDLKDYNCYYDVVLLGDSFSCDQESRRFGWQNYFINRTGLSMIVIDTRRYWPQEIMESEAFKKFPPKLFIFESVERYLHERVAYFSKETPPPKKAPLTALETLFATAKPLGVAPHEEAAKTKPGYDPDHVLGHLGAIFQRQTHLNNQVQEVPLAQSGLFSSPNDRDLLVYFDESRKKDLKESDYSDLRGGISVFQKIIESNGITQFVLLIAPDKTSSYAPYLKNPQDATVNLVAEVAKDPSLPVPRTDKILTEAIAAGIPDVYLSNDSHWGSHGHRLFAKALADFLGAPDKN